MILNREEALSGLQSLGLPLALYGIGEREPRAYFKLAPSLVEILPEAKGYLPLWEEKGEAIVAYDMWNQRFVRRYFEDSAPGDTQFMGNTYQQFLTRYFFELYDAGLDERVETLSMVLGYRHLVSLRKYVQECAETDSTSESDDWKFINQLG